MYKVHNLQFKMARWLNWLERPVHTREVVSSSLTLATIEKALKVRYLLTFKAFLMRFFDVLVKRFLYVQSTFDNKKYHEKYHEIIE